MAASTDTSTTLDLASRAAEGSRSARRLRRTGRVPGVIYGGEGGPELFAVDGRILRNTLAHSGAILEISVDGGATSPVLVKDIQRHPVRGEAVHLDLLRVDMKVAIQTHVTLELLGGDHAPGVMEGGVLSQGVVEINIEALPGDIPDAVQVDVHGLAADGVTLDVLDEHRRRRAAVDGDLEDRARTRQGVAQDPAVHREELGSALATVDHARDPAGTAQAAGRAGSLRGARGEIEGGGGVGGGGHERQPMVAKPCLPAVPER